MKEVFDFKNVGVIADKSYLQPGMYTLSIKGAKFVKPEGKKPDGVTPKTTYLEITLGGEAGEVTSKFFITPKAFDRIQTIYTNWFDKSCDKVFDSTDAIGMFFEMAFNSEKAKKTFKRIIVGGRQVGDKVYAELPYSGYVVPEGIGTFVEGPFEKNSAQYIYHVRVEKPNPSMATTDAMLPMSETKEYSDDLPF